MLLIVFKGPQTEEVPVMLDKKFSATSGSTFECINGEFEYIFNNRVDLETALALSCFVWLQLPFHAPSHCVLGSLSNIFDLLLMCFDS